MVKTNNRKAFTLVELMIVCVCLSILIGPIYLLIRSGTQTSLKGMLRIDTTLKARNVLQQVYADLKMACFRIPYGSTYSFGNLLTRGGVMPNVTYQFYSFPIHHNYDEIFESPSSGINYRIPVNITYSVENSDNPELPFKKLVRTENFNGKITKRVLTENLNFFEIKEIVMVVDGKTQYYYLISLQLVDVLNARDANGVKTVDKLDGNNKDVVIADFYDVVYPEYFQALWNDRKTNPNWHTQIKQENLEN